MTVWVILILTADILLRFLASSRNHESRSPRASGLLSWFRKRQGHREKGDVMVIFVCLSPALFSVKAVNLNEQIERLKQLCKRLFFD